VSQLVLHVTPGAASDGIGPFDDGILRVRVTRPPEDGEANRAVTRLVGRAIGVPPTSLVLVAGQRSRRKRVRVDGPDEAELERRLRLIGPA
jgi:uncharacterized protein (TIGR00251 family)